MKPIEHVKESNHLPEFLRDFHDQKDLFKTIWEWWGDKIEDSTSIKWIDAHIFTIDYFLWFMGIHGYKLQKDRTKNVDFRDIQETIDEAMKVKYDNFTNILKSALDKGNGRVDEN